MTHSGLIFKKENLTIKQAAQKLGISERGVRSLTDKLFKDRKENGKTFYLTPEDIALVKIEFNKNEGRQKQQNSGTANLVTSGVKVDFALTDKEKQLKFVQDVKTKTQELMAVFSERLLELERQGIEKDNEIELLQAKMRVAEAEKRQISIARQQELNDFYKKQKQREVDKDWNKGLFIINGGRTEC